MSRLFNRSENDGIVDSSPATHRARFSAGAKWVLGAITLSMVGLVALVATFQGQLTPALGAVPSVKDLVYRYFEEISLANDEQAASFFAPEIAANHAHQDVIEFFRDSREALGSFRSTEAVYIEVGVEPASGMNGTVFSFEMESNYQAGAATELVVLFLPAAEGGNVRILGHYVEGGGFVRCVAAPRTFWSLASGGNALTPFMARVLHRVTGNPESTYLRSRPGTIITSERAAAHITAGTSALCQAKHP